MQTRLRGDRRSWWLLGVLAGLLAAGCATTGAAVPSAPRFASNGGVSVGLFPDMAETHAACVELTVQMGGEPPPPHVWYRGCVAHSGSAVILFCTEGDIECLAHEIRHIAEPSWTH